MTEPEIEEHTVHFTVDGEGMTDLARNALLSEDPGRAWRIMSSLIGDGSEGVGKAVLDGTMKLVNAPDDDTLLMAVEDSEDDAETKRYLEDLHYIYAGRIRFDDGTWWRPTSTIKRYGAQAKREIAEDMRDEPRYVSPGAAMRDWDRRCAEWYCGPRQTALRVGKCWVIWEPCGERPHWWDPNLTTDDALNDAVRNGRVLDVVGGEHPRIVLSKMTKNLLAEETEEVEDVFHDAHEERRELALVEIGEKVREQAGDDTFVLVIEADATSAREVVIPRAPFVCWALSRTALRHLSPPWETVASTGVKMTFDDPYHTDWMLGAGLDLETDYGYGSSVTKAAYEELFRIQEEMGGFEAAILVDHGSVRGIVGKEVLVLPNLSPVYAEQAMAPGVRAIVAEHGGRLAHLSIVGREHGWTIMRVKDATTRYPEGSTVTLDPQTGTVHLSVLLPNLDERSRPD